MDLLGAGIQEIASFAHHKDLQQSHNKLRTLYVDLQQTYCHSLNQQVKLENDITKQKEEIEDLRRKLAAKAADMREQTVRVEAKQKLIQDQVQEAMVKEGEAKKRERQLQLENEKQREEIANLLAILAMKETDIAEESQQLEQERGQYEETHRCGEEELAQSRVKQEVMREQLEERERELMRKEEEMSESRESLEAQLRLRDVEIDAIKYEVEQKDKRVEILVEQLRLAEIELDTTKRVLAEERSSKEKTKQCLLEGKVKYAMIKKEGRERGKTM